MLASEPQQPPAAQNRLAVTLALVTATLGLASVAGAFTTQHPMFHLSTPTATTHPSVQLPASVRSMQGVPIIDQGVGTLGSVPMAQRSTGATTASHPPSGQLLASAGSSFETALASTMVYVPVKYLVFVLATAASYVIAKHFGSSRSRSPVVQQHVDYGSGHIAMVATTGEPAKTPPRVLGITGTLGAGKGTIVDLLAKEEGFVHYSVRSYLIECIEEQGLPVNRDSMTKVANELRAANSPAYIVEQLHKKAMVAGKDCIIESIRTIGEVTALRALGNFQLLAVDADPRTRYERAFSRASETDSVTFETFIANEQREMDNDDPSKQNLGACMQMADFRFNNDGTQEELYAQVREALASK